MNRSKVITSIAFGISNHKFYFLAFTRLISNQRPLNSHFRLISYQLANLTSILKQTLQKSTWKSRKTKSVSISIEPTNYFTDNLVQKIIKTSENKV